MISESSSSSPIIRLEGILSKDIKLQYERTDPSGITTKLIFIDSICYCENAKGEKYKVSLSTAWKFFVVRYLINDEYTVELPLKRGKQRVWVPTANGGASPTPRLSGAKPPSPHLLSLKRKKAKKLSNKKIINLC